jgi:hypothetical protein
LIINLWTERKRPKLPEIQVVAEIDARFSIMTKYFGSHRFSKSIYNKSHSWMVHEYRAMMKVILGVLTGICPKEGIRLVREYLIINYLSQYPVHNDTTLGWLDGTIDSFWAMLRDPNGLFIKYDLVTNYWALSQLHYFRHYAECVREKGALTSYSTDKTEIWHKILKEAYKRSNKIPDQVNKFIVTYVSRITSFRCKVSSIDFSAADDTASIVQGKNSDMTHYPTGDDSNSGVELDEEIEEDFQPPKIAAVTAGTNIEDYSRRISWPKDSRRGWPELASATETMVEGAVGFMDILIKYYWKQLRRQNPGESAATEIGTFNDLHQRMDPVV